MQAAIHRQHRYRRDDRGGAQAGGTTSKEMPRDCWKVSGLVGGEGNDTYSAVAMSTRVADTMERGHTWRMLKERRTKLYCRAREALYAIETVVAN